MDSVLRSLLNELFQTGKYNDTLEQERNKKMLNLEPETAHLLSILVRSSHRTRLLEIGTSNGYSTIWLAWAAGATGGRITSIDCEAYKHELADANLRRAGLREFVDLIQGDATAVVRQLAGPFDFVFFDADRRSAPEQLRLLLPRLTSDVLVLADNALSHADEIADYLATLAALPDFEHMIIPIGKGLSLAYRSAGG
ncbi:MAG: class I SAM-dependent methyltransferase [Ktedonobacteraceae bacterium]|nr:class I SAM-dependent methyltransferase [Ktedonobacteraceae bacterium]